VGKWMSVGVRVGVLVELGVGWVVCGGIELSGVWVVLGLGTLFPDLILDPGNGRPHGWGP